MNASWRFASRSSMLGVMVLIATFVAGALAGAAADRMLFAGERKEAAKPADRYRRHDDRDLLERLSLTQEQKARIDPILERRRAQVKALWAESRPRTQAILDSTRTEIRALLTPEQQAIEEQVWRERREHFKRRAEKRHAREEPKE